MTNNTEITKCPDCGWKGGSLSERVDTVLHCLDGYYMCGRCDTMVQEQVDALIGPKYYIMKAGIYMHGLYGPYNSVEEAKKAFQEAYDLADEGPREHSDAWYNFDGYHIYSIIEGLGPVIGGNMPEVLEEIEYKGLKR